MPDTNSLEQQLQTARSSFIELVAEIRPELHRYCTRMTGSLVDGEDMVQEVLAQAFFKLGQVREGLPLRPWLFRIAHNRCIDFLRGQSAVVTSAIGNNAICPGQVSQTGQPAQEDAMATENPVTAIEKGEQTGKALTLLLDQVPPKERSFLLLKEMMGYSLKEISALSASSEGAVKSALHRAREKLTTTPALATVKLPTDPSPLLAKYIDQFNAQNWDAVTELLEADATLNVVGVYEGEGKQRVRDTYMTNYTEALHPWWFEVVEIDGQEICLCWQDQGGSWVARSLCRIQWSSARLAAKIDDYRYSPYMLNDVILPPPPDQRGLLAPATSQPETTQFV